MPKDRSKDVLYIQTPGQDFPNVVPYYRNMKMCDYLLNILVPALDCSTMHNGSTVTDRISYTRPDGVLVHFDRATRLELLGDMIPPNETLRRVFALDDHNIKYLHGNATAADFIEEECPICLDPMADYQLRNCKHRFHVQCLCNHYVHKDPGETLSCPMCRTAVDPEDEWGPWQAKVAELSKADT